MHNVSGICAMSKRGRGIVRNALLGCWLENLHLVLEKIGRTYCVGGYVPITGDV